MELVNTATGEIMETVKTSDRSKQNADIVMLYRQFIAEIANLGMEDVQALRVLLFIVRQMDTKNALVCPMSLMSEMLNISRQTVSNKIKYLHKHGWIAINKTGRSNVYVVNPAVVWTSYADEKKYCRFEANVMLSSEDNWALPKDDRVGLRHIDRDVLRAMANQEFGEDEALSNQ